MKLDWSMTAQFFDRAVVKNLSAKARKVLSRFGAFTRRSARSSLKTSQQRLTLSELPAEQRQRYHIRMKQWAAGRLAKQPQLPTRSSPPGQPPYVRSARSPLKLILFAYDPREESVTVGPVAFGKRPGEAPAALEYSGTVRRRGRTLRIAARPFMGPAAEKNLPHLRNWRQTA